MMIKLSVNGEKVVKEIRSLYPIRATSRNIYPYPAVLKYFKHSSSGYKSHIEPTAFHKSSTVLAAMGLRCAFSLEKAISMGFRAMCRKKESF